MQFYRVKNPGHDARFFPSKNEAIQHAKALKLPQHAEIEMVNTSRIALGDLLDIMNRGSPEKLINASMVVFVVPKTVEADNA